MFELVHLKSGENTLPGMMRIGLRVKILIPSLIVSVLAALVLFGWFGQEYARQSQADLRARLQTFTSTQAAELGESIWTFDQGSIDRLFRSYTCNSDLLQAGLFDADGNLLAQVQGEVSGKPPFQSFVCEQQISRKAGDELYKIGRLEVVYHDGAVRRYMAERRTTDLMTLLVVLLLLAIATAYAIHLQIGLPLRRLGESFSRNALNGSREPLIWSSRDEIGDVVVSYNALLAEVDRKTRHLEETNAELQRENDQRTQAEARLKLAFKVLENSSEGIIITDKDGIVQHVNPSFTSITGFPADEVIGGKPNILRSGRHSTEFYETMWQGLIQYGHWAGEIWNCRKNGQAYPQWLTISAVLDSAGTITNYVALFHDITEYKKQQEVIEFHAYHDPLTGLPNRLLFDDRLCVATAHAGRQGHQLALLFLDLDNFKNINDSLGHLVGDGILKELAERLGKVVRAEDTLSRLGGDEFTIILPKINSVAEAAQVSQRIFEVLSLPFQHQGMEIFSTVSIGIAIYPNDGLDTGQLIKNADLAMYRAKHLGRNNYQFFAPGMDSLAQRRFTLETKLRKSIEKKDFELYYQPIVNIASGRITGCEALLRWRQNGAFISPSEFIPLAEETGLIIPLGGWVLKNVCRQACDWSPSIASGLTICVNISARQFNRPDFEDTIRDMLQVYGLPSGTLHLELTESVLMANLEATGKRLQNLRQMGVKIMLDDFGTGYSSLSYLKHLPIDGLKIDRSFVKDIPHNADSKAIVASIIHLAKGLNLEIVAEGVETFDQLTYLREHKCDLYQGYYAYHPVPAYEFERLMPCMGLELLRTMTDTL